jgi:predicted nucleic acid-binding protein
MRVLLDTKVVLDVLLQRLPWLTDADAIWQAGMDGRLEACITASSLTDLFYIARRLKDEATARQAIRSCLDNLTILPVDNSVLETAYQLPISDYEDAVQPGCAAGNRMDALVTRDPAGFIGCTVLVLSPAQLAQQLAANPPTP